MLEDIPKPPCSCRLSDPNGGQFKTRLHDLAEAIPNTRDNRRKILDLSKTLSKAELTDLNPGDNECGDGIWLEVLVEMMTESGTTNDPAFNAEVLPYLEELGFYPIGRGLVSSRGAIAGGIYLTVDVEQFRHGQETDTLDRIPWLYLGKHTKETGEDLAFSDYVGSGAEISALKDRCRKAGSNWRDRLKRFVVEIVADGVCLKSVETDWLVRHNVKFDPRFYNVMGQ